jgi:hypothetical protein
MPSQAIEAEEFVKALYKLHEATASRSDSTSQRQSIDKRSHDLTQTLLQAEKAYDAATGAYTAAPSTERLRAWEAAHRHLREVQAWALPQDDTLFDLGHAYDRGAARADGQAGQWRRKASGHLKTMQENLQAAQDVLALAVERADTIESWLPQYELRERRACAQAVSANRSKIELSAGYAQDVYTLQKREAVKTLVLAVVSAAAGTQVAIEKASTEYAKTIGARVGLVTIRQILTDGALRNELLRTSAAARHLLQLILRNTWTTVLPAAGQFAKSILTDEHKSIFLSAGGLRDELIAFSPDEIDSVARGPMKRHFERIHFESPMRAGIAAKLYSVPAGKLTRTRGGFQEVEDVLSASARQERYFRVWEELHRLARQVALSALAEWRLRIGILQDDVGRRRDLLERCQRLAAQAGIGG